MAPALLPDNREKKKEKAEREGVGCERGLSHGLVGTWGTFTLGNFPGLETPRETETIGRVEGR